VQVTTVPSALEQQLERALPGLVLPAPLLMRLAEVLGPERVEMACGNLRPLGFGAYDGSVCLVTPNRVLLATATGPNGLFGIEEWEREVGPVPTVLARPTLPAPRTEG
jgi:hypothetical protein